MLPPRPNAASFGLEMFRGATCISLRYVAHGHSCICLPFRTHSLSTSCRCSIKWFALMASVNITLRWKAAQALQFAQAAQVRTTNTTALPDDPSDDLDVDAALDDDDAI